MTLYWQTEHNEIIFFKKYQHNSLFDHISQKNKCPVQWVTTDVFAGLLIVNILEIFILEINSTV